MSAAEAPAPEAAALAPPAPTAPRGVPWNRAPWIKTVGSLKFAVVLIFGFAAVMVFGLWYEGEYGTPAAQVHVYKAWWFNLMFVALAANIAGAAIVRYPWPKRLTGFVITHLGLLVLIGGTLVSRLWGIEGTMMLFEGEVSDRIILRDRRVLNIRLPDGTAWDLAADDLRSRVGRGPRQIGQSPWTLAVLGHVPVSEWREWFEPDSTGLGPPAVEVRLTGANFGDQTRWMVPTDARGREWDVFGMLLVDATWLHDAAAEQEWRASGDPTRQYRVRYDAPEDADSGVCVVQLPDGTSARVTAEAGGAPTPLSDGAVVRIDRVLTNATVTQGPDGRYQLEDLGAADGGAGPAVILTILWDGGAQEHTAFARMPEFPTRRGGHATLQDGKRLVRLGLTPDGRILGFVHDPGAQAVPDVRELRPGEALATPWAGIAVTVSTALPAARRRAEVVRADPADVRARGEEPVEAAQLEFTGPASASGAAPTTESQPSATTWVQFLGRGVANHPGGPVQVEWRHAMLPLGFTVRLLDFRKVNDPGAMSAASFESDVFVEDALRGRREKVLIRMNEPLLHGGPSWMPGLDWAFYQESYNISGDREMSQLQVAYDPGYPIVLVGSLLLVLGIFTMFYLVPYFQPTRRRAEPAPTTPAPATPTEGASA